MEKGDIDKPEEFAEEPSETPGSMQDDPSADYEVKDGSTDRVEEKDEEAKQAKKKSALRDWGEALIFAFIGVIILKAIVFEPFAIPSDSMGNTLWAGDYVVVNKLLHGARLPMTPLTIPFSHQKVFGKKAYIDWWQISYARLPGYGSLKRNDVVVFNFPAEDLFPLTGEKENYPVDHRTHFIKRIIGLPGDTVQIADRITRVNGKEIPAPADALYNYIIKIDSTKKDSVNLKGLGLLRESQQGKYRLYTVTLLPAQADSVRLMSNILSVEPELSRAGLYDEQLFPHSEKFPWNLDNYGKLVVPKKGATILLTPDSLPLYQRVIVSYEHKRIDVRHDSIFINDVFTTTYTFEMDYYFVMGDNRHYSMDSRYWGFVPEDHVVGKATMILFSYDKVNNHVRWNRCFRKIN
ncbi:MAG TPA: signal peptidase I [Bacteroidia bacterium]|nr:signal peptidase I [Bacteroidia bacterium]